MNRNLSARVSRKAGGRALDPPPRVRIPPRLAAYFLKAGYVREPNAARYPEGHRSYKKGWEVRIIVTDRVALAEVRRLLEKAGLAPARPFAHGRRIAQPLYGAASAAIFAGLERTTPRASARKAPARRAARARRPLPQA